MTSLALLFVFAVVAASADDGCKIEILDQCGVRIFIFGLMNRTIPTTEAKIQEFCAEELEAMECAKGYIRKCMKPLPQQFAGVLVQSATKEVQSWCHERKSEYLSSAACFSPYGPQIHQCMIDLIAKLDVVAESEAEDKLGIACCSFAGYRKCTLDIVRDICDADTIDFLDNLISAYASELMDLACSGHEPESETCLKMKYPEPDPNGARSLSLLAPLSQIVQSL